MYVAYKVASLGNWNFGSWDRIQPGVFCLFNGTNWYIGNSFRVIPASQIFTFFLWYEIKRIKKSFGSETFYSRATIPKQDYYCKSLDWERNNFSNLFIDFLAKKKLGGKNLLLFLLKLQKEFSFLVPNVNKLFYKRKL
jgi:hypothetical protein